MSETVETAVVSAEPAQLQQVILNICNNAVQAMDKPGVIKVEIETREISEARRLLRSRSIRPLRRDFDFRFGPRHG
jgi:signal transduction histidine kinase